MSHGEGNGIEALRWIIFVPAAGAGAILGPVVVGMLNAIAPGWWENTVGELAKSAGSGIAFVLLGSITAPRARFNISVVLAIIFCVLTAMIAGRAELTPWLTTNLIVGIVAAFGTCSYVKTAFPE